MKEINILLVEDNEGDIVLTLETFNDLLLTNKVSVVRDGEEAIRYLNKEGVFAGAKTLGIIFLDINLPKIDGKELLDYLQNNEHLKHIPTVMLTTSASQTDMDDCMAKNAAFYFIKPLDVTNFFLALGTIKNFRLSLLSDDENFSE